MYKKIVLVGIAVLFAVLNLAAQAGSAKSRQAVQQTILNVFDALSNRDSVALATYCTADSKFYESGKIWNLDSLINIGVRQNRATDFKRVNTIDFIETEVKKDVAWTTYYNQAEFTSNGKQRTVRWLETVVLLREKKLWKIKLLHSTLVRSS